MMGSLVLAVGGALLVTLGASDKVFDRTIRETLVAQYHLQRRLTRTPKYGIDRSLTISRWVMIGSGLLLMGLAVAGFVQIF